MRSQFLRAEQRVRTRSRYSKLYKMALWSVLLSLALWAGLIWAGVARYFFVAVAIILAGIVFWRRKAPSGAEAGHEDNGPDREGAQGQGGFKPEERSEAPDRRS